MIDSSVQTHTSDSSSEKDFRRCSAYCTASRYPLEKLMTHFRADRNINVLHRVFGKNDGDVFYFIYGTVVMWGLTPGEEQQILSELKEFEEGTVEQFEFEDSRYSTGKTAKISKNDITLPSDNVVTKLAFSHGLAQSVKLSVFERLIERRIENSKHAPESLAKHGRIPMSRKQLAKMMGEIILDRNSVNFHTDILDTPEFFWEYSDLEPLYRLIAQDLDIVARVNVLNKRLDIVKELLEMLSNELENRHSSTLEWIIITLISVEVLVTFAKEVFGLL